MSAVFCFCSVKAQTLSGPPRRGETEPLARGAPPNLPLEALTRVAAALCPRVTKRVPRRVEVLVLAPELARSRKARQAAEARGDARGPSWRGTKREPGGPPRLKRA